MTSDRDALYRSVCLHPDEDVPRLAYADLIEEEGDSFQAAFIRAQVELARVPDYDPFAVKCRQFNPEFVNGWAMAHTLPALPTEFSWHSHVFRRGFPWLVQVRYRPTFLEQLAEVLDTTPIQSLHFPHHIPVVATFANSTLLAHLCRVEFSNARLERDELTQFGYSPLSTGLTEFRLDLDVNRRIANELWLWSFARTPLFTRLEVLELAAVSLGPELLVDALATVREPGKLRKLVLARNRITHDDAARLFSLPVVQGLSELDMTDNKLNPTGVVALVENSTLARLLVLNLGKTFPGVLGVKALADSPVLHGLRSLDLSANRLGPVAVRALTESPGIRGLRVLKLGDNPIGVAGVQALAACPQLSGLLELDLENCGIDDAGAIALAESPHLDGLLRLLVRDRITGRELGEAARAALRERFGECVTM